MSSDTAQTRRMTICILDCLDSCIIGDLKTKVNCLPTLLHCIISSKVFLVIYCV